MVMRKNFKLLAILLAVVAFGIGYAIFRSPAKHGDEGAEQAVVRKNLISRGSSPSVARTRIAQAASRVTNVTNAAKIGGKSVKIGGDGESDYVDENGKPWPEADKRIARVIDKALDEDDFKALKAAVSSAAACSNKDIRDRMVDALGTFGACAVPELLGFMSDPDEDVAENARGCFQSSLSEIEADDEKAAVIELVMKGTECKDVLEDVADELSSLDELLAMQIIVDAIDANPGSAAAVEAARAYNDITDEDWSGFDAAENWLQNNYNEESDEIL